MKRRVAALDGELQRSFDKGVLKTLSKMWGDRVKSELRSKLEKLVKNGWRPRHEWNTYKKDVREHRISIKSKSKVYINKPVLSVNWNREILDIIKNTTGDWHVDEQKKIARDCRIIDKLLRDFCNNVFIKIEQHPGNSDLKNAARRDWIKYDRAITALSTLLKERSLQVLKEAYQLASTETDIGCLIVTIRKHTYEQVAVSPGGRGSYAKRRKFLDNAILIACFAGKTFLEYLEALVLEKLTKDLAGTFTVFKNCVMDESKKFEVVIEDRLLTAHAATKGDLDVLDWLKEGLPAFKKELEEIKALFPEVKK